MDGAQSLDLQRDALLGEGVDRDRIYEDQASGAKDVRRRLGACLRALRDGDVLVVWKLDHLGHNLGHLVGTVQDLSDPGVGLRVLAGQGAQIDTTAAGARQFALSKAQVRLAQAAMAKRDTTVAELCRDLGIGRVTLYRSKRDPGNGLARGQVR